MVSDEIKLLSEVSLLEILWRIGVDRLTRLHLQVALSHLEDLLLID